MPGLEIIQGPRARDNTKALGPGPGIGRLDEVLGAGPGLGRLGLGIRTKS
jgi:hypothetical protein